MARSNEAKSLGVQMGTPLFQIKELVEKEKIYVFSSNYVLYGDMSNRVMKTIADSVPHIDIYSIDEAFLNLQGFTELQNLGLELTKKVLQHTGIPVSLGISPTKVLAKMANKYAKKYTAYNRVCIIDTEEKRIKALKKFPIYDVWGIGRKFTKRLQEKGIETAYDFTQMKRSTVRAEFTVVGERIYQEELQGISCIKDEIQNAKKQICTSRSFAKELKTIDELKTFVARFASQCAYKQRKQNSVCSMITVFLGTNRFTENINQYWNSKNITLSYPTLDTSEISKTAIQAIECIYRSDCAYKKCGVILSQIESSGNRQLSIFDNKNRSKQEKINKVLDIINDKYGRSSCRIATEIIQDKEHIKSNYISPQYSTNINDIIKVK